MSTLSAAALPEYVTRRQKVLEDLHSEYQHIVIAEDPQFGRLLYLDEDLQISEADRAYDQTMIEPLLRTDNLGETLILGGGDGGVLRAAVENDVDHAVMVDIDQVVVDLCQQYLPGLCEGAFEADNAELVIDDAFAWLTGNQRYDAIIYDLTMEPVRAGQSRTDFIHEILARVADSLSPHGVFSMQCCSEHDDVLREEIAAGLVTHFGQFEQRVVEIPSYAPERWVFASASGPKV